MIHTAFLKRFGRIVAFLLLLIFIIEHLDMVFIAKHMEQEFENCNALYTEEENSLNVIYLGSSMAYTAINPVIIYEKTGLTGYVYGSGAQRIWTSKYYLQEALKRQKPECIVLEVGELFNDTLLEEERTWASLDYCKFSKEKVNAIFEAATNRDGEIEYSVLNYFFPLGKYKERWKELQGKDFEYLSSKHLYDGIICGYTFDPNLTKEKLVDREFLTTSNTKIEIPEKCKKALDEIVEICNNEEISLVLIKTSILREDWTYGKSLTVKEYAEQNGIDFIDYNLREDFTLDIETERVDEVHLNYRGAEKFSEVLGEDLVRMVNFDNAVYDNEIKEKYEGIILKYNKLKEQGDLSFSIASLDKDNSIGILNSSDISKGYVVDTAFTGENTTLVEHFKATVDILDGIILCPITWNNEYSIDMALNYCITDSVGNVVYQNSLKLQEISDHAWYKLNLPDIPVKQGEWYSIAFSMTPRQDWNLVFSLLVIDDFNSDFGYATMNNELQNWSVCMILSGK